MSSLFLNKGDTMAEISFKERVRTELLSAAMQYKSIYLDYEYLICSEAFSKKNYYIIAAAKDNFMHLTGVNALVSAQEFFDKCYDGSLSESDFDFSKSGQNEKSVKGTVRRKIKVLPDMMQLFHDGLLTEEEFKKNNVICSFAAADGSCTLGFVDAGKARPKSLIRGNELNNPSAVDLVIRRKAGAQLFDEILVGDEISLNKYKDKIKSLISHSLLGEDEDSDNPCTD